ncbi:hypothetical protein ACHQM5_014231 [Ranunculus cassubicifolius]
MFIGLRYLVGDAVNLKDAKLVISRILSKDSVLVNAEELQNLKKEKAKYDEDRKSWEKERAKYEEDLKELEVTRKCMELCRQKVTMR